MSTAIRNLRWVLTGEDKSASKALDGVGKTAEKVHHKFGVLAAGLAGGAIGAGVAEFGKKAVEAAVEGEGAQARLAQAVKNTGGSMEDLEPKVAKLSTRFAKLGFTNDEVESGLASMTTSLRDPEKALNAMGLAADLAKYKNISLSDASVVVAKAMEGQLRPLKQLGIDLPVAAGGALKLEQAHTALAKAQDHVSDVLKTYPDALDKASKHHAQYQAAVDKVTAAQDKLAEVQNAGEAITKGLTAAIGGQASAAADTYAGKIAAMHAQFENFQEQVGTKLLPVLLKLMNGLQSVASFVDRNRVVLKPLGLILGTFAATVWTITKAMKAWAAIQAILDLELAANPIGLVVIALAALSAGLIYAYKHCETFRLIVQAAFAGVVEYIHLLLSEWSFFLRALGHVPGFGWATRAANAIDRANQKVVALKNSLLGLPKDTTVSVHARLTGSAAAAALIGGSVTGVTPKSSIGAQPKGLGGFLNQQAGVGAPHLTVHVHQTTVVDGKTVAKTTTTHQTKSVQRGALMPGLT